MKKKKERKLFGSIEYRTADIVRRAVKTISKGRSGKDESTQHIIDSGIIPRRCPTTSLPITRSISGATKRNPKRELQQIKPGRVDVCPSAQSLEGPKRTCSPDKCIPAQDQSTLSDPNIHRTKKKKKSQRWRIKVRSGQKPPTLRECETSNPRTQSFAHQGPHTRRL